MYKLLKINDSTYFNDEPFTKREAYLWLASNLVGGKLSCSIRQMAYAWKWHKSKVERFINKLKLETLIEIKIESGKMLIMPSRHKDLPQNKIIHQDELETSLETKPGQDSDNSRHLQDSNKELSEVSELGEDIAVGNSESRQKQDDHRDNNTQKEKKKRTKKRKEKIKEKNIPFGNIKKEKFENNILQEKIISFQDVETKDVEEWINETLKISINIEWELGKFKDYWLSTRKKPPKDGIAAFRNWIRKSIEINNERTKNDKFNNIRSEQIKQTSTSFERFLTSGVRALSNISGH